MCGASCGPKVSQDGKSHWLCFEAIPGACHPQVLVARLKNSQNIACDKVDDVLLKDLADEVPRWGASFGVGTGCLESKGKTEIEFGGQKETPNSHEVGP